MIVIYSQDKVSVYENIDSAKKNIIDLYGEKLGKEACNSINENIEGTTYRKHGGPLIQIISKEKAEWIKNKEASNNLKKL